MNRAPFLLTMPTYGGSLAAIRSLGERGVRVTVAGEHFLAPARWSRYAARWKETPPVSDTKAYLDWLLDFGRQEPGHVLYPTSDDLAFLFAANAEALSKDFLLYQPPVNSLLRVLDKMALHDACEAVGLDTVPTWCPETEDEVAELAKDVPLPLLIKARTQVMRLRQTKGNVIEKREDLLPAWKQFVAEDRYAKGVEGLFGPKIKVPMVQQYFPRGAQRVYSVTGFIDRSGELFDARGAVKVLQRTRPVGLGLCFEAAALDEELTTKVAALCRAIGHFGVFEVEFIRDVDRCMVIDFNPRFYGQMGFEAARGLPLALMCYLGACGDEAGLRKAIAESRHRTGGASIYTHRFVFELLLVAQRLGGTMTSEERRHWSNWYAKHRETAADASASAHDWLPGVVHAAAEVLPGVRALKKVVRRSSEPPAPANDEAEAVSAQ